MTTWEATWHAAPAHLSGVLTGVWSLLADPHTDLSARVLPDGSSFLVFLRNGTALRSSDGGHHRWNAATVTGPRTSPLDFTLAATGQMFIVQLRPAGARRVLGIPMSSLANDHDSVESMLGSAGRPLEDVIGGESDEAGCVRAIEQWLTARCRQELGESPLATFLAQRVRSSAGNVRVGELADEIGITRRHLLRVVKEHFGTSPKTFARIVRFDHAVQLSRARPEAPWSQIALDAGYADQPHMSREFGELGGIRPRELRGAGAATIW